MFNYLTFMLLEPQYVAMTLYLTQGSLVEQHHQPLFAAHGIAASGLHCLHRVILHTSARAAMAPTVLKIVPGIHLANRLLSSNGHLPLLHVLAASPGDCERFHFILLLLIYFFLNLIFFVPFQTIS